MWVRQALVLAIIFSVLSTILSQECDNDDQQCSTTTSGSTETTAINTVATDAYGNPTTPGINAAKANLVPVDVFGNFSTSVINAVEDLDHVLYIIAPQDDIPRTAGAIPTDDPSHGLPPAQYSTQATRNTEAKNSGLIALFNNEIFSGQIPSVLPTDESGNPISISSGRPTSDGHLVSIINGQVVTVPSRTNSSNAGMVSTTTERNSNEFVTDDAAQLPSHVTNSATVPFDPTTEVFTNTDGNNYSAGKLTQNYADIYTASTNTTSDVHRISRGVCGLTNGGPLIQPAVPAVTSLCNSLVWSGKHRALYLVDGLKPALLKYTPSNGKLVTLTLAGTLVQTILPTANKNQYVVELDHRLVLLENPFAEDQNVTSYEKELVVFHSIYDLGVAKTDSHGRIWIPVRVQTSNNDIIDQLYLIWKGKAELKGTFRRNRGMAWSPDNKHFYLADSEYGRGLLYVYDFSQKTAEIKNRTVLFNLNDYPDLSGYITNIAIDNGGDVWASMYQDSSIIKIDHNSGKLLEIVPLPTNYPVSLAFGDNRRDVLFVGTAYNDSRKADAPYVYGVSELNVKGTDATTEIKFKDIFGSETMHVTVSKTGDAPINDLPSINSTTCSGIKELLAIKKRKLSGCTVVKDTPIVQEALAPIKTSGSSLYWNYDTNAMYFADMSAPSVIKYAPYNGKIITVKLGNITTVTSITPIRHKDHHYILSTDNLIVPFNNKFETNSEAKIQGQPIASLKDKNMIFSRARTDDRGRLWIGTKSLQPTRSKCNLYMLQRGKLVSKISKVSASGGLTWSLDNKQFYFADSGAGKIYSYNYNKFTGAIRNRAVLFDIAKEPTLNGTVEDLTTDSANNIWATISSDGVVLQLNRETGGVEQMIALPIKYPVSLEFGGVKRDTLFVISAHGETCKIDGMPSTYAISNLVVSGTHANYNYVL